MQLFKFMQHYNSRSIKCERKSIHLSIHGHFQSVCIHSQILFQKLTMYLYPYLDTFKISVSISGYI